MHAKKTRFKDTSISIENRYDISIINRIKKSFQETRIVAANFDHTIGVKTPEVTLDQI